MNGVQIFITVIAVALGAVVTRTAPFILFPESKELPKFIKFLGGVLPPAMMGLLVVYCLKDISFISGTHGIPELIAIIAIVFLHRWKSNVLLSIGGGTVIYILMVQVVF